MTAMKCQAILYFLIHKSLITILNYFTNKFTNNKYLYLNLSDIINTNKMGCLWSWITRIKGKGKHQGVQELEFPLQNVEPESAQSQIPKIENLRAIEQQSLKLKLKSQNLSPQELAKLYHDELKDHVVKHVNRLPNSIYTQQNYSTQKSIKQRRLPKEIIRLMNFLPCQITNSIFVRYDEAKTDSMNVLISGSKGTPYSSGFYHFEMFCDENFPLYPPKMQILTGKGKVKFNPKLHQNGKVCLTLLGTRQGSAAQTWSVGQSSLLQVLVSIQSILSSKNIIYDQPQLAFLKGTTNGTILNQGYSNVIKIANIRYAMIDIIKNPPKGFEIVVKKHFLIKRRQIIQECEQWLREKEHPFENVGYFHRTLQEAIKNRKYCLQLQAAIEELKTVLLDLIAQ